MKNILLALPAILSAFALTGCTSSTRPAMASDNDRVMAEADFERLKALSGDWYLVRGVRLGVEVEGNDDEPFMTYSVSSGGHSVIEELLTGKPNEMTSVYYLDTGRLMMDHYCSLGNQPRMVAAAETGDEIPFTLLSVSNMTDENDLHISSHSIEFDGPDKLTVHWGATKDSKPMDGSFYRVRRHQAP